MNIIVYAPFRITKLITAPASFFAAIKFDFSHSLITNMVLRFFTLSLSLNLGMVSRYF